MAIDFVNGNSYEEMDRLTRSLFGDEIMDEEKNEKEVIDSFTDDYFFLSNFYECPVLFLGYNYNSSEAAFQAQKCPERAKEFTNLSPDKAKKLGKTVKLREDWESVKDSIMLEVVRSKFIQNEDLFKMLIETGDVELIEGNWWGDKYWGVCNGGKNKLGKILMQVRKECIDFYIPKE